MGNIKLMWGNGLVRINTKFSLVGGDKMASESPGRMRIILNFYWLIYGRRDIFFFFRANMMFKKLNNYFPVN